MMPNCLTDLKIDITSVKICSLFLIFPISRYEWITTCISLFCPFSQSSNSVHKLDRYWNTQVILKIVDNNTFIMCILFLKLLLLNMGVERCKKITKNIFHRAMCLLTSETMVINSKNSLPVVPASCLSSLIPRYKHLQSYKNITRTAMVHPETGWRILNTKLKQDCKLIIPS